MKIRQTVHGLIVASLMLSSPGRADAADCLEADFRCPPASAKPHTWYHMMNGNVSQAGITRDFEALAEAGFGGVQMFDAGCDIPPGGLDFNSPEWFDLLRHAAAEARRLGLEICIPNCSGWSSSGGPWNPPSNSMKRVVFTETAAKGPCRFSAVLPREKNDCGYYADIATLAFPRPPADARVLRLPPATLETTLAVRPDAVQALADGAGTAAKDDVLMIPRDDPKAHVFTLRYAEPVTADGFAFQVDGGNWWSESYGLKVEVSADGTAFETAFDRWLVLAQSGSRDYSVRRYPFDRTRTFQALRVRCSFGENARGKTFAVSECAPIVGRRLADVKAKTFDQRLPIEEDTVAASSDQTVPLAEIRDLTSRLAADGTLAWDVPAGDWRILRIGCVSNGRKNHPASEHGVGLEVDKLSAEAMDYHFEQYVARIVRHLGPLAGDVESGFNNILVDSYEVGSQNWTQKMADEFRSRRGYDLTRYLPTFAGYIVGSVAESERFLEDFRRTVADLFAENYAGALTRKCHQYGLKCSIEPYGNCPADNLQYGQYCDIPMGEFWSNAANPYRAHDGNAKYASYVAHVWGKPICATESFTAHPGPSSGRWMTTPFGIKAQGDLAYSDGVNRFIYHRFAHQPWADDRYLPGMTMGRWGMHLDRTQTWWPLAKPFFRYQSRCQYLLRRGTFVADVLFFAGEEAPNQGRNTDGDSRTLQTNLPPGYDHDVCPADAMYALKVVDGEVVAPGGVRYRLLVMPPVTAVTPRMMETVRRLQRDGAKIAWERKPVRAPGLSFGAAGDAEVRRLADEIFAAGVFRMPAGEALRKLGVEPQVKVVGRGLPKDVQKLNWIHRREGSADWFFTAIPCRAESEVEISFRAGGRVPEIWDAESGRMEKAAVWRTEGSRTVVRVPFTVCGSKFVVFREVLPPGATGVSPVVSVPPGPADILPVAGPWRVTFPNGFLPNAMAKGPDETVTFDELQSWSDRAEEGVRYFSGRATYHTTVTLPAPPQKGVRYELELGRVCELAEVTVNGRTFDALWHPPYRVDITDALRPLESTFTLDVCVANLWANRLIGDDRQYAPDCEWLDRGSKDGVKEMAIKEIPAWVKAGQPSPTGRHTFTTWRHWSKDDKLLPSGLLGPVTLRVEGADVQ